MSQTAPVRNEKERRRAIGCGGPSHGDLGEKIVLNLLGNGQLESIREGPLQNLLVLDANVSAQRTDPPHKWIFFRWMCVCHVCLLVLDVWVSAFHTNGRRLPQDDRQSAEPFAGQDLLGFVVYHELEPLPFSDIEYGRDIKPEECHARTNHGMVLYCIVDKRG